MSREVINLLEKDYYLKPGDFVYLKDKGLDTFRVLFVAQIDKNLGMLIYMRDCNRWNGEKVLVEKIENDWCFSLRGLLNWEKDGLINNYDLTKIKIQKKE